MAIRNTKDGYGLIARLFHWVMALAILMMFAFGKWMRTLDYYSPWYKQAPDIHKSIGLILLAALIIRFLWRIINTQPDNGYLRPIERRISSLMHWGFYLVLLALMIAGYFISTVDGRAIDVFNWFSIPSLYEKKGLEDTFGLIHEILGFIVIGLVIIHAAAALKHHFRDRDSTLLRMWQGRSRP